MYNYILRRLLIVEIRLSNSQGSLCVQKVIVPQCPNFYHIAASLGDSTDLIFKFKNQRMLTYFYNFDPFPVPAGSLGWAPNFPLNIHGA